MKEQVYIRQETEKDFEEVFKINSLAFNHEDEAKLVNALRQNSSVFIPELSLVAILNNEIIGHILFTKINIKDNLDNIHESLALAPMAVIPEYQNNGIGSQLIKEGLIIAKKLGYNSVIVLGHEDYYPKFGFEPTTKWEIKAPFEVPDNAFMAIELEKDSLKNKYGTVIYPKEFESV